TATLPFAAVAIWQQRSSLLQFLIVSVALVLVVLAVWEHWDDPILDLSAIFVPVAAALLLFPPRRAMQPTAFAMLIVPQLLEICAMEFDRGWQLWYGWPAKVVYLGVFACLIAVHWRQAKDPERRLLILAGAAAAAAVSLILPGGASIALVL